MATFPTTPANGDLHTIGGRTWTYNSATDAWQMVGTTPVVTSIKQVAAFTVPRGGNFVYTGGLAPGQWLVMPGDEDDIQEGDYSQTTWTITPYGSGNIRLRNVRFEWDIADGSTVIDDTISSSGQTYTATQFGSPNTQIFEVSDRFNVTINAPGTVGSGLKYYKWFRVGDYRG